MHGVVAVEEVFVGAAPGVVHPHAVVGGNGPVLEVPAGAVRVFGAELFEDTGLVPEL